MKSATSEPLLMTICVLLDLYNPLSMTGQCVWVGCWTYRDTAPQTVQLAGCNSFQTWSRQNRERCRETAATRRERERGGKNRINLFDSALFISRIRLRKILYSRSLTCWIRLHVQSSTLITSLQAAYIIHGPWILSSCRQGGPKELRESLCCACRDRRDFAGWGEWGGGGLFNIYGWIMQKRDPVYGGGQKDPVSSCIQNPSAYSSPVYLSLSLSHQKGIGEKKRVGHTHNSITSNHGGLYEKRQGKKRRAILYKICYSAYRYLEKHPHFIQIDSLLLYFQAPCKKKKGLERGCIDNEVQKMWTEIGRAVIYIRTMNEGHLPS